MKQSLYNRHVIEIFCLSRPEKGSSLFSSSAGGLSPRLVLFKPPFSKSRKTKMTLFLSRTAIPSGPSTPFGVLWMRPPVCSLKPSPLIPFLRNQVPLDFPNWKIVSYAIFPQSPSASIIFAINSAFSFLQTRGLSCSDRFPYIVGSRVLSPSYLNNWFFPSHKFVSLITSSG